MSLAADVAIGAAERIERSAGPGAGLAVYKRLATSTGAASLRARALLGGLRCALALRDLGSIRDLVMLWETLDGGSWDEVFATMKDMWRAGLGVCATDLANAEIRRFRTARALYAYARCLDVAGDARAGTAFADAVAEAQKEGAPGVERTARVRRVAWLSRVAETLPAAIEEAKRIDPKEITLAERLVVAQVLLRAPSRFVRAGALGLLDELVTSSVPDVAERALRVAARHVDDVADGLTSLETDRLLALFGREPYAKSCAAARETVKAVDRIARAREKGDDAAFASALDDAAKSAPELGALHARAREILAGRFEAHQSPASLSRPGAPPPPSAWAAWTPLLDAVVAMRDAAPARASTALRVVCEMAERGDRLPPQAWTIAQAALQDDDAELRGVAGRLVASMVKTSSSSPPPRGWLALATSLAACGMDDLATVPRRAAALAKEPGAEDALALALTRSAWQLARSGERSRAIARLQEAKAIAQARGTRAEATTAAPSDARPPSRPTPST